VDLDLTADQEALRGVFADFFASEAGPDRARAADGWIDYDARHSPVTTIYGGTTEINRNNVAERHLGLPRAR
jgi:hypothetical protein